MVCMYVCMYICIYASIYHCDLGTRVESLSESDLLSVNNAVALAIFTKVCMHVCMYVLNIECINNINIIIDLIRP